MREKKHNQANVKVLFISEGLSANASAASPLLRLSSYGNVEQSRQGRGLLDCYSVRSPGPHKTKMSGMSGRTQYLPLGYFLILAFISSMYLVKPLRRTNNEFIYKR